MIATAAVVDDSEVDLLLARRVLERSGTVERVECFAHAEAALARLRDASRAPVDIVFLDVHMPGTNGFEVLDRMGAEPDAYRLDGFVAMLTTSRHPLDVERARRSALVSQFLVKPLTVVAVMRTADLLERRRPVTPGTGTGAAGSPRSAPSPARSPRRSSS